MPPATFPDGLTGGGGEGEAAGMPTDQPRNPAAPTHLLAGLWYPRCCGRLAPQPAQLLAGICHPRCCGGWGGGAAASRSAAGRMRGQGEVAAGGYVLALGT